MTGIDAATDDALARFGDDPLVGEVSDAAIVAGALAGLDAGLPPLEDIGERRPRWRGAVVVAFVSGALAAAVLLVGIGIGASQWLAAGDDEERSLAPAISDDLEIEGEAVPREAVPRVRPRERAAAPAIEPDLALEPTPSPQPAREHDTPRAPKLAAADLLRSARNHLEQGESGAAMARYRELQRRFPTSAEARAALVSMGRLELRRGHPKAALAWLDRYLATGAGTVREEARYHRILALRQLGRHAQERAAIEAFLADHPSSVYAPRLRPPG